MKVSRPIKQKRREIKSVLSSRLNDGSDDAERTVSGRLLMFAARQPETNDRQQ